jgi:ferric-chelate reductase
MEQQIVRRKSNRPPPPMMQQMMHPVARYIDSIEFIHVKFLGLLCGAYVLLVTFTYVGALGLFGGARDPETGFIIDPSSPDNTANGIVEVTKFGHTFTRAVVSETSFQLFLTGLARFSAFFMYPPIVVTFWVKFRAIQGIIDRTPLMSYCFSDTHRLHEYCGWIIFYASAIHTIAHLIRWGLQGNLYLLFHHFSGITGFIVVISTLAIVIPMTWLKRWIRFEVRKYVHYLFWVFCMAMTFHAPLWALPNAGFCAIIFPTIMILYFLDASYVKLFMTEKITTVKYETLSSGVQLTMPVSERFQKSLNSGGYGYVMFDWIDRNQWHAFSFYQDPLDKECRRIFIAKAGDWTNKVHSKMDRNTVRPVWLSGPFPSPYSNASNFDSMILVASGIGITPALSAVEAFRDSRRINLIWAVREADMLVFFLKNAKLDHKGFNLIFYTGKDPLPSTIENHNSNANLQIIRQRPNISGLIPNIIRYIDQHGKSEHEEAIPDKKELALALVKEQSDRILVRDGAVSLSVRDRVAELTDYAAELGYSLIELVGPLDTVDEARGSKKAKKSTRKTVQLPDGTNDLESIETVRKAKGKGSHSTVVLDPDVADPGISTPYIDRDNQAADLIMAKINGFNQRASEILRQYDAQCDCPADHIVYPHHRHSIWRTNNFCKMVDDSRAEPAARRPNIWESDPAARLHVKRMALDDLETYGLMYCGGRSPLLEAVQKEAKDLNVVLHQEAFDW